MKLFHYLKFNLAFFLLFISSHSMATGLTTYYHNDHLGSPVYASDDMGKVQWTQRYMPYGEKVANTSATAKNDIWYTGKPHDDDTGLTYMNARHYDPVIGRFMGIDPVGYTEKNQMSFNRYLYVNNNPYKYNDPDGEFLNFVVGGAWAAAQNIAIQNIEIALGVRQEFSYGELAAETALGVVTSGASTVKNAGKLTVTAVKYSNKVDDAADTAKVVDNATGIVYLRSDRRTGETYVGQTKSAERYDKRQKEHNSDLGSEHDFKVLGYAKPGKDLDVLEETLIRTMGGLRKEGGTLANKRHQMSEERYRAAGGTADKTQPPPPPPPPAP